MGESNGTNRIAGKDKAHILLGVAGLILTLAIPIVGVGVGMLTRLGVVETKVEDLRQDTRDLQREIRHSNLSTSTAKGGG